MAPLDRAGIADRLRALLAPLDSRKIAETATHLGVEEVSLRMSIDEDSPHPTVEVLSAVIREYGVDPTWLLSGVYDAATHRSIMEGRVRPGDAVRDFISAAPPRISRPVPENFRTHDQN